MNPPVKQSLASRENANKWLRPGGGAWGNPSDEHTPLLSGTSTQHKAFEPRGSVHAFTAAAEAAQ
jgi:hypothetical protein